MSITLFPHQILILPSYFKNNLIETDTIDNLRIYSNEEIRYLLFKTLYVLLLTMLMLMLCQPLFKPPLKCTTDSSGNLCFKLGCHGMYLKK